MLIGSHDTVRAYVEDLKRVATMIEENPEEQRAWCAKQLAERRANPLGSYDCESSDREESGAPETAAPQP